MANNRQVNPLTVQLPAGKGVPPEQMRAFIAQVKAIEQKMKHSLTPNYAGVTFIKLPLIVEQTYERFRSDRNNPQPC